MPQFGILIYLPEPADPEELARGYLDSLEHYPAKAQELGGKVLGGSYFSAQRGFAFGPSTMARAIRDESASNGPLVDADLVVAAFYILQARDLETAVQIAKLHPAAQDGGIEIRPMFVPTAG